MYSLTLFVRKIYFVLLTALVFVSSCVYEDCEESFPLSSVDNQISLRNEETGELLVGELGERYDPDKGISVLNDEMQEVDVTIIGDIIAFVIDFNNIEIGDTIRNTYFLDLPPWEEVERRDIDTMYFEHIMIAGESKCVPIAIGQLNYYYNSNLVFSGLYDELPGKILFTPKE